MQSEPSRNLLRRRWLASVVLLPVATLFAAALAQQYLHSPLAALREERIFEIEAGTPLAALSRNLRDRGIIEYPLMFNLLARFRGLEREIRHGVYELPADATPAELLDLFVSGKTRQFRLTLIEGWTFARALAEIQRSEGVESRLRDMTPGAVAKAMNLDVDVPEGMIFPDTYFYDAGDTDLQLLLRANARLREILALEWESRSGEFSLETPYQALILASIVEKEAAGGEHRLIAGVFLRRLQMNMRLQSDPTVIYGLGSRFDGDLRATDLVETTVYNTYRINGLPPTPIALAGHDSIRASLRPTVSDYLYFVGTNDGKHYFSETLEEHNAAVDCYQRNPGRANCVPPRN